MKVIYSPRAIRDLERIAAYYMAVADPNIAEAVGTRIEHVINRIARSPFSAPRLTIRPAVRMALVLRYPYKIFIGSAMMQLKSCTSGTRRIVRGKRSEGRK
jgi:toxin ParE1/3/4